MKITINLDTETKQIGFFQIEPIFPFITGSQPHTYCKSSDYCVKCKKIFIVSCSCLRYCEYCGGCLSNDIPDGIHEVQTQFSKKTEIVQEYKNGKWVRTFKLDDINE